MPWKTSTYSTQNSSSTQCRPAREKYQKYESKPIVKGSGQKEIEKLLTLVIFDISMKLTEGKILGKEKVNVLSEKVNDPLRPIAGI